MDFCPFTNKPCSNAKIIHITDILNGEAQQMHLCQNCADKYLNPKKANKPDPLLEISQIIAKKIIDQVEDLILNDQKIFDYNKCPNCGISEQEILSNGRFGCGFCYEYFEKLVNRIIKNCQEGETKHIGKVPKQFEDNPMKAELNLTHKIDINEKIKILESKIKKAVEIENYEIAQMLKLKIQELKETMNHNF